MKVPHHYYRAIKRFQDAFSQITGPHNKQPLESSMNDLARFPTEHEGLSRRITVAPQSQTELPHLHNPNVSTLIPSNLARITLHQVSRYTPQKPSWSLVISSYPHSPHLTNVLKLYHPVNVWSPYITQSHKVQRANKTPSKYQSSDATIILIIAIWSHMRAALKAKR